MRIWGAFSARTVNQKQRDGYQTKKIGKNLQQQVLFLLLLLLFSPDHLPRNLIFLGWIVNGGRGGKRNGGGGQQWKHNSLCCVFVRLLVFLLSVCSAFQFVFLFVFLYTVISIASLPFAKSANFANFSRLHKQLHILPLIKLKLNCVQFDINSLAQFFLPFFSAAAHCNSLRFCADHMCLPIYSLDMGH